MAFDLTAALRLNDVSFTKGMRRARGSMRGLKSGVGEVVTALGLVTTAAAGIGVAMASVNKAMDFESQMSSIKALMGNTSNINEEMALMQKLALDMGAQTKYSALEAAQGIEELIKAGVSPATVKAGGLEAALTLATAGGLELAEAAEIMSTALNSFSKDGMTAAQASNILAGTANASATDVHDLRYSLSMVSAVAAGVGLSFKDVNSALGVFANKGLKGSDAGTSLKTLLLNLSPITKKQTKLFDKLGIATKKQSNQFYDAKGNIKSMAEIAEVLHNSLSDLTNEQRQATMKEMFGTDAIRAANILYNEGAKGIKKFQAEMSKVTALDVAKEKMNNASGAVEQFKGAMETLQIAVLLPLMPVIKDAANAMADFVANLKPETIQTWGDNIKSAAQGVINFATFIIEHWVPIRETIIGITVALVAFKAGMIAMSIIGVINNLMIAYRAGTLMATIAQYGLNTAMLANPVGLVIAGIAALIAIGVLLYRNWDTVKAKAIELWAVVGPTFKKIGSVILTALGPVGTLFKYLVSKWGEFKSSISNFKMPKIGMPKMFGGNGLIQSGKSHAGGLSNVPYNGYQATLHKGERVLTPEENDAYKNGSKGGNINVSFAGANFNVRKESDIDAIADKLAHLIMKQAGVV